MIKLICNNSCLENDISNIFTYTSDTESSVTAASQISRWWPYKKNVFSCLTPQFIPRLNKDN